MPIPPGAALFNYYTAGELRAEGTSITEGIGQGRITGNLEGFTPDAAYLIPDVGRSGQCLICSSMKVYAWGHHQG